MLKIILSMKLATPIKKRKKQAKYIKNLHLVLSQNATSNTPTNIKLAIPIVIP